MKLQKLSFAQTLTTHKMPPKKKGDGKGGPKPGTKQAKAVAEKAAGEVKKQVPEEPKKPSVKDVIGGASWTGKLPVNMLAEHCQKQKWEKPEYNMVINFPWHSSPVYKHIYQTRC